MVCLFCWLLLGSILIYLLFLMFFWFVLHSYLLLSLLISSVWFLLKYDAVCFIDLSSFICILLFLLLRFKVMQSLNQSLVCFPHILLYVFIMITFKKFYSFDLYFLFYNRVIYRVLKFSSKRAYLLSDFVMVLWKFCDILSTLWNILRDFCDIIYDLFLWILMCGWKRHILQHLSEKFKVHMT